MKNFLRIIHHVSILVALLALASCAGSGPGPQTIAKSQPWRTQSENACLAAGHVRENRFLRARSSLGGPGVCGASNPFIMSAAVGGRVTMQPPATLRCPMIPHVDRWVANTVIPAANHYFGSPVVKLHVAASYGCRTRNNKAGAKLSEHGLANAIDISSFTLANGRTVTVKRGWNNNSSEQGFLRSVHRGACNEFTTVLGPKADKYHHDHFHLDLARHGRNGTYRVCR